MTEEIDTSALIMRTARALSKLTQAQRVHVLLTVAKVLGVELHEKAKA